jgi:hypothetical protein
MESGTPWRDTAWAISEENVELLRRATEAFNRGDIASNGYHRRRDSGRRRQINPDRGGNVRGKISIALVALLIPALIAAVALATTASGKPSRTTITLRLRSQIEHVQFVDNAPQGRSAGDVLLFTERLLDTGGQPVGSDAAQCTFLFDERSLCTGTYILPDGQVMVQLLQPGLGLSGVYTQAITGGTGAYARATGTVTVDQRPDGDRFSLDIHLPKH